MDWWPVCIFMGLMMVAGATQRLGVYMKQLRGPEYVTGLKEMTRRGVQRGVFGCPNPYVICQYSGSLGHYSPIADMDANKISKYTAAVILGRSFTGRYRLSGVVNSAVKNGMTLIITGAG